MLAILKIEWLKIRNYRAFWWVVGITALTYMTTSYMGLAFYKQISTSNKIPKNVAKMWLGNPFSLQEIWHTTAYISSFFIIIPSLLVIMLITNEYAFRTNRQNIIDGWSRNKFLTGKLLDVTVISLMITALYVLTCILIGFSNSTAAEHGYGKIYFVAYFLLQTFSQLSLALFIGLMVRKSFIALGIFIFSSVILEPAITWFCSSRNLSVGNFLPFEISDKMIPPPAFMAKAGPEMYKAAMDASSGHFYYTAIFIIMLWVVCFKLNAKSDI